MMDYKHNLVSVIIPTYKRNDMLDRAIYSVLTQTYKNIEVLIVNDNVNHSDQYSNSLYDLIRRINDERVVLIQQDRHINGAAARNAGIRAAKGEYIAFLDDDDYWEREKVEIQVSALKKLDSSWGATTCLNIVKRGSAIVSAMLPYSDGNILIDILERRIGIGMDAAIFRRVALDDAGYFDESLRRHQDLQLFAQFANKYKIKLIKRYLNNIDITDAQNRPDPVRLEQIKAAYYQSIANILDGLSLKQKKQIFLLNDFETAYSYAKSGNIRKGIRKAIGILSSPLICYLAVERCIRKLFERNCYFMLLKKYR